MRPQDIRHTALLTIEGELDDISGAGQTKAAHDLCGGIPAEHRFHYDAVGAGHYGIFSGRRWREMVYPRVRSFIGDYDKGAAPATRGGRLAGHDLDAHSLHGPVRTVLSHTAAARTAKRVQAEAHSE